MSTDDKSDARSFMADEPTPLPDLFGNEKLTPDQLELKLTRAELSRARLEMARMQAEIDELRAANKRMKEVNEQIRAERRILAERIRLRSQGKPTR